MKKSSLVIVGFLMITNLLFANNFKPNKGNYKYYYYPKYNVYYETNSGNWYYNNGCSWYMKNSQPNIYYLFKVKISKKQIVYTKKPIVVSYIKHTYPTKYKKVTQIHYKANTNWQSSSGKIKLNSRID